MNDAALVRNGDCILIGSPVGTSVRPISFTLECQERGAYVIALTNREFEDDPRTLLEHPLQHRLHEIADLVVDIPGPLGDGVFNIPELQMRAIPHSGITGMTAMWMIFSEALSLMRAGGQPLDSTSVSTSPARVSERDPAIWLPTLWDRISGIWRGGGRCRGRLPFRS